MLIGLKMFLENNNIKNLEEENTEFFPCFNCNGSGINFLYIKDGKEIYNICKYCSGNGYVDWIDNVFRDKDDWNDFWKKEYFK